MYRIFSDVASILPVFENYSVKEALQVKINIEHTLTKLDIPSPELLAQMEAEGIDLAEFANDRYDPMSPQHMASGVIKNHLKATFLDSEKLFAALSPMTLVEKVEVQKILLDAMSSLRLPSQKLMEMMENEGLNANKLGLETPNATAEQDKLNEVKQRLGGALKTQTMQRPEPEQIAALQQKLTSKLSAKPINEFEIARKKNVLSSALQQAKPQVESNVVKLKAKAVGQ
ncbi:hypothetical protein HR060_12185 [Catenovulum sp. SM1970]|uniref:hypothetical protein n=1 Tax=Marinifaba aquimaris TaxID=2741323 RepID=UPI0015718683|nr:hypothetical protein [Marinifaba aquimaris]NTS77619.1 hypothetical protein [Marinifaba aquimaris]